MSIKRVSGAVLTILGIEGLILTAIMFMNTNITNNIKALAICGILGLIFFTSGIGLVWTTKDEE